MHALFNPFREIGDAAWISFAALSLANLWYNWRISIKQKRFHGIFRLVSFECIILLVILQLPLWFREPLSLHQAISWILLAGSLLVACSGFITFYRRGRPRDGMEETTKLIKTGLFRYIRHPLYFSLILGGFGVMAKDAGTVQAALALINFAALYITARTEEAEMIRKFGPPYREYMRETAMFLPFIL
jgi:protein-S-isoprenylcysteine O-methyltransferase Ste14